MSSDSLVFLSGMAAAFAAGVALAFAVMRRRRAIDPAVEGQWLAEIAGLRRDGDALRAEAADARARCAAAEADFERLRDSSAALEHQVGSYLKQYAVAKDTLKKEILQKNALRTELAATQAEVEALRARIMELQYDKDPTSTRRVLAR